MVVFGGRTFRIPSSPAAAPTSFVRIIDGFDPRNQEWNPATRSGITSAQLVARGFGESVIAKIGPDDTDALLTKAEANLFIALTNQTSSLEVLRKGLEEEKRESGGQGPPSAEMIAAMRARMSQRGGGPASGGSPGVRPTSTPTPASPPAKPKSPQDLLWDGVKSGKRTLFVNVNNASSILYLSEVAGDSEKAKVALIADGDDLLLTFEQLDAKKYTLVMPPRIDLIPNSRNRVNVARMLDEAKYELAFSLSLNQNEYVQSQDSPLFSVSMLVRSGLSAVAICGRSSARSSSGCSASRRSERSVQAVERRRGARTEQILGGIALRVGVDHQGAQSTMGADGGEIAGNGGLADPALLVEYHSSHRPLPLVSGPLCQKGLCRGASFAPDRGPTLG